MGLNAVKYRDEMLFENDRIDLDTPGTMGEYKELRADALEADTLDITVLSESGTIRYFDKNEKVEFFRSGSRVGTYHLQSVTRVGPKLYTLSALSAVGLLIVRPHRGSIYTGQTVAEVVAEICGDIPILIETVYRNIKLYGWLPIASARDNLRQVLFAIGAWLHTDENGTLRVQKLWDGTASVIDFNSVDSRNIHVKYLDPVSAVAVTEHQYIAGTEDVTLFEGTAQQGDVIEFDEPAHTLAAEGFTVLESGANYAVLSAGTGKLTGKSYVHNRRVVTRTVTEGAAEHVEEIADATLVSLVNSSAVAQRMAAYYACREQLTVDVNPAAEHAGHVVSLWNEWDKQQTLACIASRETKISGLLKSRTSALVGFLPPQPESSEYFDERVILTGSGVWTVPEGVTSYTRVLIGGGRGGSSGHRGESPAVRTPKSWTEKFDALRRYVGLDNGVSLEGGAGGEAGLGGMGGKILIETVQNAVPGTKVPYSCGVGGAGGIYSADGSVNGSEGTATTMGGSSSNSGSHSENGYTDPTTGESFSLKGDTGIAGSKGHGKVKEGNSYVDKPSPTITYNGVTYTQGADGGASEASNGGYKHEPYHSMGWSYDQALGGGPAAGNNGSAGGNGFGYIYSNGARITTGRGGKGGDAVAPAKETAGRGKGGKGGNGGGGGGSAGRGSSWQRWPNKGYTVSQANLSASSGGSNGGGKGSDGGQGGDGCIIIYYRKKKELQSGPLVTSNNLGLLDSLGRRMIV